MKLSVFVQAEVIFAEETEIRLDQNKG